MPDVSATLTSPFTAGVDTLYCPAFALAWRSLAARFGPLFFDPQPALADALNGAVVDPAAIDPAWCVARAGFGAEGILDAIRAELASKFEHPDPRHLPANLSPDGLLAYCYLAKDLRFPTHFAIRDAVFAGKRVRGFGILPANPFEVDRDRARMAQVVVQDYASNREFVLELLSDDASCRILVAQVPRLTTLEATVRDVLDRLGRLYAGARLLQADETVSIPRLSLDVTRRFTDFVGRPLRNGAVQGRTFDEAVQQVRFKLDQGGASVIAEAAIIGFGAPPAPPRTFHVTQPFLVMLIRRAAPEPFLALWVETTEWMEVIGPAPEVAAPLAYAPGGFGVLPPWPPPKPS